MGRTFPIILGAILIFGVTAAGILHFMPEPVGDSDYLVAGSIATMAAVLVLFLGLVSTRLKSGDVFFKKRPKQK